MPRAGIGAEASFDEVIAVHPLAIYGLSEFWSQLRRVQQGTIICVNVGGCLIPLAAATYELVQLAEVGWQYLLNVAIAAGVNTAVFYLVGRPMPGGRDVMPGLVSPLVAASRAEAPAPDQAPGIPDNPIITS